MALFKCEMCDAPLEIAAGTTTVKCEYCGTQHTLSDKEQRGAQQLDEEMQKAKEAQLAEDKRQVENEIIDQKNLISKRFVRIAYLFSIGIIVLSWVCAIFFGVRLYFIDDEVTNLITIIIGSIIAFALYELAIAALPNLLAYLSMRITHQMPTAKMVLMIIAFVISIPSIVVFGIAGIIFLFIPDLASTGVVCILSSLLNILACIYMIVLKIILAIKQKQLSQN